MWHLSTTIFPQLSHKKLTSGKLVSIFSKHYHPFWFILQNSHPKKSVPQIPTPLPINQGDTNDTSLILMMTYCRSPLMTSHQWHCLKCVGNGTDFWPGAFKCEMWEIVWRETLVIVCVWNSLSLLHSLSSIHSLSLNKSNKRVDIYGCNHKHMFVIPHLVFGCMCVCVFFFPFWGCDRDKSAMLETCPA